MHPLMQAMEQLQRTIDSPISNMEMIRRLANEELKRRESPQMLSFICEEDRELFEQHLGKVQAFLESADGCDAWGLLVEAFRSFVEPPAQAPLAEVDQDEEGVV
ncbi:hypothetical protein ACIQVE_29345 [Pseudomonas sp. NPDC098747]|uniref:hypothetical protein n=1 Tax=Pseudomonas sp. NPDC098747 TaxID=3364487 RepID=UPI00383A2AC5